MIGCRHQKVPIQRQRDSPAEEQPDEPDQNTTAHHDGQPAEENAQGTDATGTPPQEKNHSARLQSEPSTTKTQRHKGRPGRNAFLRVFVSLWFNRLVAPPTDMVSRARPFPPPTRGSLILPRNHLIAVAPREVSFSTVLFRIRSDAARNFDDAVLSRKSHGGRVV